MEIIQKEEVPSLDSSQMEEIQEEEVPRGELDIDGHHLFIIASYDGSCYLVNGKSGKVYWRFETDGFLHMAKRGENVDDYADLKEGDFQSQLYHFKPNNPSKPQLIPFETKELLEVYFNQHHEGGVGTDVSKNEIYYLIDYQTGKFIHWFDSYSKAAENNVFENKDWFDQFLIKRVDFYLHRSSPFWSLRFARIEAWFSHSSCPEIPRTQCLVYHTSNIQSYVSACVSYKLIGFPSGCAINNLIMEKSSLSFKNIELEDKNQILKEKISNLHALLSRNSKIDLSLLTSKNQIKTDENGSEFFKGTFDGVEALIEKARRDDSKAAIKSKRLWGSGYHPNICAFLGWESDGTHDYFAFEKCHKTLKNYIHDSSTGYKEMSEESIIIMSGLVSGISHLHSKNLFHKKLSLDNIWISGDKNKSIKIGGVENCEFLGKVQDPRKKSLRSSLNPTPEQTEDHRIDDLYDVAQFILVYMTKGIHKPPSARTTLMTVQFYNFKIKGTNREVLDLLQKLNAVEPVQKPGKTPASKILCNHIAFWPAPKRLRYFQDLSNYLDETVPRPEDLRKAINSLTVVPNGNSKSNWRSKFEESVIEAMIKLPEKKGRPKEAQQDPKQAQSSKQDLKKAESSKQDPPEETTKTVNYNYTSPVSLIRFMRNGFTHIQTFSSKKTAGGKTLKDDLGSNEIEFEEKFRTKFPDLFVLVYAEVEKYFKELPELLQRYYQA